jgi:hypothetical protein
VLPGPFYLNDVLVAPDLVQSLLSICRFTTDNSCSMEFDAFGLSVKDRTLLPGVCLPDMIAPVRFTLYLFLLYPPLLHMLSCTP